MNHPCAAALPVHLGAGPGEDFDVVVRTRLRLNRNLAAQPFLSGPQPPSQPELLALLRPGFLAAGFSIHRLAELDRPSLHAFVERELLSRSYAVDEENHLASHPEEPLWASFCQRDHVLLHTQAYGLDLQRPWLRLEAADAVLHSFQPWAFDSDFGYLSAEVGAFGCGLSASLSLHLPALELSGYLELALKQAMDAGFLLGGSYGSGRGPAGALYELSLPNLFAESEATALSRLERAARALAAFERSSRLELLERSPWEALDLVGRALGRARYAHSVGWDECTDIISGLRLGLALSVLEGMSLAEVTDLWYSIRAIKTEAVQQPPDHARRSAALRQVGRRLDFVRRYRDV